MRPRIIVLLVASCAAGPRTRRSAARRWFAPDDGDLDVSLDHGDVAAWGAASRSAALEELGEALDARPSGRALWMQLRPPSHRHQESSGKSRASAQEFSVRM